MYNVWWAIAFLVSFEAVMWAWTINRHATWLRKHPELEKRISVSYMMLRAASFMAGMLSILVWCLFMYITITELAYEENPGFWIVIQNLVIISVQLSHTHFMAIIARYSCLPRSMWPLISKLVSIILVKWCHMKEPVLTSYDVHSCHELSREKECKRCEENKCGSCVINNEKQSEEEKNEA